MNYMTIKEAGEKWGLGIRIITQYCVQNRIEGALKKGNTWIIPSSALKPEDGRRKPPQEGELNTETVNSTNGSSYEPLKKNGNLFAEIFKRFPYPMHICAPDGTIHFFNNVQFGLYTKFGTLPYRDITKRVIPGCFLLIGFRLTVPEFCVLGTFRIELIMTATADNCTLFHHHYTVGKLYRTQAVSYNDGCLIP